MSKLKLNWGIAGIDFTLTLVIFILFAINSSVLLDNMLDVKTEVDGFEQFAATELDLNDPDDLELLNNTLANQDGLKDATLSVILILFNIALIFIIFATAIKALEYKLLLKKPKYINLLWKFFAIHLGLFLLTLLYLMFATSLTSYLGFVGPNSMSISLIIGALILSYLLFGSYTFISKKKFDIFSFLKIHSVFVVVSIIYYYIFKLAVLSLESLMSLKAGFIFSILMTIVILYVGHLIVVTEQVILLE